MVFLFSLCRFMIAVNKGESVGVPGGEMTIDRAFKVLPRGVVRVPDLLIVLVGLNDLNSIFDERLAPQNFGIRSEIPLDLKLEIFER